jgi:hypothetical protein
MKLFGVVIAALVLVACNSLTGGGGGDNTAEGVNDGPVDAIETAVAQVGSEAGANEGGTVALTAISHPSCDYTFLRKCSGNTGTVVWGGCSVGSAEMGGGWTESFSSSTCCSDFLHNCSVTRTSDSSVITIASGANVTTSTSAHTTYDGTSLPGTGTQVSIAGTAWTATRTITLNGLRRILKGPLGTTWFDHSLVTTTPVQVTGSRSTGDRTVQQGVIKLFHNRALYTAISTFDPTDKVIWGTPSCCYPTAGKITTTLSGSLTGTMTLEFSSTCGQATLTGTDGSTSTVTMNRYQCQ